MPEPRDSQQDIARSEGRFTFSDEVKEYLRDLLDEALEDDELAFVNMVFYERLSVRGAGKQLGLKHDASYRMQDRVCRKLRPLVLEAHEAMESYDAPD